MTLVMAHILGIPLEESLFPWIAGFGSAVTYVGWCYGRRAYPISRKR
jgi:hypothetical protein